MTIGETRRQFEIAKMRLRVELAKGNGSRLAKLYDDMRKLSLELFSYGIYFDEDRIVIENLKKLLTEKGKKEEGFARVCTTREGRQKLIEKIFGEQKLTEKEVLI